MGLPNILRTVLLLKPTPTIALCWIKSATCGRSWNVIPEHAAAFRKYVQEGRLAIVGGTDVMPDVNMPSGESFVRQMLYGKRYYRQQLGVDVTVGWQLDTFGHHPQMPQLLKLGGYQIFLDPAGSRGSADSVGVHLGRSRRHADPHVLVAAQLCGDLRFARRMAGICGVLPAAV